MNADGDDEDDDDDDDYDDDDGSLKSSFYTCGARLYMFVEVV